MYKKRSTKLSKILDVRKSTYRMHYILYINYEQSITHDIVIIYIIANNN